MISIEYYVATPNMAWCLLQVSLGGAQNAQFDPTTQLLE